MSKKKMAAVVMTDKEGNIRGSYPNFMEAMKAYVKMGLDEADFTPLYL